MFAIRWFMPTPPSTPSVAPPPTPTPETRIENARRQLEREAASLDYLLGDQDRLIKDSAHKARAALDRGDVTRATDLNERHIRLRRSRETLKGQLRSVDLAKMQLREAQSQLIMRRSLHSINEALAGTQHASSLESMQALGERHQGLLREQTLMRRALESSQEAALGNIDQEVREEAEAMTEQMLAECTTRLRGLPDALEAVVLPAAGADGAAAR